MLKHCPGELGATETRNLGGWCGATAAKMPGIYKNARRFETVFSQTSNTPEIDRKTS